MGDEKPELECKSILMISDLQCPSCREAREILKDEIEKGEIEVRTVDDEEGRKIVDELGIKEVPTFICKKDDGSLTEIEVKDVAKQFNKGEYSEDVNVET